MRTAMRQMVGVFGELERSLVTKRMRDGKRVKAMDGGYCGGAPRFGMVASSGSLVEAEHERLVVEQMHHLRSERKTFRAIAEVLNDSGTPGKHGGRWHAESVRRCLARLNEGAAA